MLLNNGWAKALRSPSDVRNDAYLQYVTHHDDTLEVKCDKNQIFVLQCRCYKSVEVALIMTYKLKY